MNYIRNHILEKEQKAIEWCLSLLSKNVVSMLIFYIYIGCPHHVTGQVTGDGFLQKYKLIEDQKERGEFMFYFFRDSLLITPSEKFKLLAAVLTSFKEADDPTGIHYSYLAIGTQAWRIGDNPNSLKFCVDALKYFEEVKDTLGTILALNEIINALATSENPVESVPYWKKALPLAKAYPNKSVYAMILNNVSDYFLKINSSDSALFYIQQAVNINYETKDNYSLGASLTTLGEIYLLKEEFDLAVPFLKKAIQYTNLAGARHHTAYTSNVLADHFFKQNEFDTSIVYARQTIQYAKPEFLRNLMLGYEKLYLNYEQLERQDSVHKYYRLAMTYKDSLYTTEKYRNLQMINFTEQLRQQEMAEENANAEDKRRQNLQYAILGFGIISFLITFLLLSRSIITNTKVISFLGVVALLIVFEFFNLWLHPFLEKVTNHSPPLMLLCLVIIASILVPLHHYIERWAINRLIEKNKSIRLADAKKTIRDLEPPGIDAADDAKPEP